MPESLVELVTRYTQPQAGQISYWLLSGPHSRQVVRMALGNNHEHRILEAVHFLQGRYAEPIRMDRLAAIARLSPSAFHRASSGRILP